MLKKLMGLVAVTAMAAVQMGCAGTCEDLCDDAEEEGCGTSGCMDDCAQSESDAESAGCADERDDYYSCATRSHKVCNINTTFCVDEWIGYDGCMPE
ncbi:MAG: hypothetical protein JRI68_20400 [Deltaproteobacteria bacterium]|nr:hypothetical protein [Deltaproteobacteria bacterium]